MRLIIFTTIIIIIDRILLSGSCRFSVRVCPTRRLKCVGDVCQTRLRRNRALKYVKSPPDGNDRRFFTLQIFQRRTRARFEAGVVKYHALSPAEMAFSDVSFAAGDETFCKRFTRTTALLWPSKNRSGRDDTIYIFKYIYILYFVYIMCMCADTGVVVSEMTSQ